MKHIRFSTGEKCYVLNDDESNVIRINAADLNIPGRMQQMLQEIEQLVQKDPSTPEELLEIDRIIREKIDYAFGTEICSHAFGNINCMSPVEGGKRLVQAFFDAFLPAVQADIEAVQQENADKVPAISERVQAYVDAVPDTSEQAALPDLSGLTAEQKAVLLKQLQG